MNKLANNWYNYSFRLNKLSSALTGYERVLKLAEEGKTVRNRPGYVTKPTKNFKQLCNQSDWFSRNKSDKGSPDTQQL